MVEKLSTIEGQIKLLQDTIKQDSILAFMKINPNMFNNFTFIVMDKSHNYNIFNRPLNRFEFNGMARSVFGNQKRLFIMAGSLGKPCHTWHQKRFCIIPDTFFIIPGSLNDPCGEKEKILGVCKDWTKSKVSKYFLIEKNDKTPFTKSKTLRFVLLKFFKKELYIQNNLDNFSLKLQAFNK